MPDNMQETPQAAPPQPAGAGPDSKKAEEVAAKVKAGAVAAGKGFLKPFKNPLICVKAIDWCIEKVRLITPPELFNIISGWMARLGYFSMVVSAFMGVVFCVTAAIKSEQFSLVFAAIGFVLLLIILQFTAVKFISASEKLTRDMPTTLKSQEFLVCTALILEIVGILVFVGLVILAIDQKLWSPFWGGLGLWVACDMIAYIALHPELASVSISQEQSTGEEAIGIFVFYAKAAMRLVPTLFGVGQVVGAVLMTICAVNLFRDEGDIEGAKLAVSNIIYAGILPFVAYIVFCLMCLGVDLCRAILSLHKLTARPH